MKKILHILIKYRFVLAIIAFTISLALDLHGSSIANWNHFGVSEMADGTVSTTEHSFGDNDVVSIQKNIQNWVSMEPRPDGTLIGVPRMIRSDEWMVQTPYFISQSNIGSPFVNPLYGLEGQNMILSYNAPVMDISSIGKPFSWGFLFLGPEKGLSWYWSFKLITMLLLAFEFSMILTKKNPYLSLVGSFWITFTPAVQWWFMQHLGDVVFSSLLIMVSIYHYFHSELKMKKIVFAGLLISGLVGFPLIFYPAFQVPFAYLIVFLFLVEFYGAWKHKYLGKFDVVMITAVLLVSATIVGITLYRSADALKAILSTIYPGSRVSVGGDQTIGNFVQFFVSVILPFKIPEFSNQVELSQSISFLSPILCLLPFALKKEKISENAFGILLTVYSLFLVYFALLGVPEIFSRVTLFSFVTGGRAIQALSVIGVFVSLWFISYYWRERIASNWLTRMILLFVCLGMGYIFSKQPDLIAYLGYRYLVVIILLFLLTTIAIFEKRKVLFGFFIMLMVGISGMTVNPLVKGLSVIEDKKIAITIKEIVSESPDAVWLSEGTLYNFPQMFGAKTINSVRFYPDNDLMNKLDEENRMENFWNRYAHMRVDITEAETTMDNPAPDAVSIHLDDDDLDDLKVTYVLTNRDLEQLFVAKFKLLYGPDKDGNRIYRFVDN